MATRWSHDVARQCLDYMIERPSITGCAQVIGGSSKVLFIWISKSRAEQIQFDAGELHPEECKYRLQWPLDPEDGTGEFQFFHDAVRIAQKMYGVVADTHNRQLLAGEIVYSPLTGEPLWEVDEVARAQFDDRDSARIMGLDDWPFKHDSRGGRIPVRRQGPSQMRIATLRSVVPGVYDLPSKTENVTTIKTEHLQSMPLRADGSSPLAADLMARLQDLRENGPQHNRPDGPVPKGRPGDEPADDDDAKAAARPHVPLSGHARAYWTEESSPEAEPPLPPRPSQSNAADQSGYGAGHVLPGGMRTA